MSQQKAIPQRKPTRACFRKVFGSEDGKRVLRWLMVRNYILNETPHDLSERSEGRRNAVLDIVAMVMDDLNPDQFIKDAHQATGESRMEYDPTEPR